MIKDKAADAEEDHENNGKQTRVNMDLAVDLLKSALGFLFHDESKAMNSREEKSLLI